MINQAVNHAQPESPRNLIAYDAEIEDLEEELENLNIIKSELKKWCDLGLLLLFSLILLQIHEILHIGISYSVLPIIIFELKSIITTIYQCNSPNLKKSAKDTIKALGNLIFTFLLIFYLEFQPYKFLVLIIPLFISMILSIFIRTAVKSQCQSFSSMYFFCGGWVKILTILSIGLKLDGYTDWTWIGILWPIWVLLSFLCVMSIGCLLVVLGSLCSYYYSESVLDDLYSSFWLFYSVSGALITLMIMFISLLSESKSFTYIYVILYLILDLILTKVLFNKITRWWKSIYSSNEPNFVQNAGRPPVIQHNVLSLHNIIKVFKLPPQTLLRLSGIYFQPANSERRTISRTLSDEIRENSIKKEHIRSLSSPGCMELQIKNRRNASDMSFAEKKCVICIENECDAVIMDCGHGGVCFSCAEKLRKSNNRCHICRSRILQILKIKVEPTKVLSVVGVCLANEM